MRASGIFFGKNGWGANRQRKYVVRWKKEKKSWSRLVHVMVEMKLIKVVWSDTLWNHAHINCSASIQVTDATKRPFDYTLGFLSAFTWIHSETKRVPTEPSQTYTKSEEKSKCFTDIPSLSLFLSVFYLLSLAERLRIVFIPFECCHFVSSY